MATMPAAQLSLLHGLAKYPPPCKGGGTWEGHYSTLLRRGEQSGALIAVFSVWQFETEFLLSISIFSRSTTARGVRRYLG